MAREHELVKVIRDHYDRISTFYHALWGDHIHHGYWENEESPKDAQVKLIARLAEHAGIWRGARVLDVGCGLGGSSLWLARNLSCSVTGITLSPVQVRIAAERARVERLDDQVHFLVRDANRLDLPLESFDVVWVVECSEHLADKADFIATCARLLKPGGKLALGAWLAVPESASPEATRLLADVCRGMLCPSLASLQDYARWMEGSGFSAIVAEDITRHVARTWTHCAALVERPEIKALLRIADARTRDFVKSFGAIRRAYAEGAMAYGMFTAAKS
jgi:tocopherol O-methyltransferase